MPRHFRWFWIGCGFVLSVSAIAGTSGSFGVNITLANPAAAGLCISESSSDQTQALVRVVCRTGQFVDIAPREGKPFLGTHGGAFRYVVRKGSALAALVDADAKPYIGAGTVTALRIYNADGRDGPLEMLVSF